MQYSSILDGLGYYKLMARRQPADEVMAVGMVEGTTHSHRPGTVAGVVPEPVFLAGYESAPGTNPHVTAVANRFYGSAGTVTPERVFCSPNMTFGQDRLGIGTGEPPASPDHLPPVAVWNHSWASAGGEHYRRQFAARLDFLVERQGEAHVCGCPLTALGDVRPTPSSALNVIRVGTTAGAHWDHPLTLPHVVVPTSQPTSFATPYISAMIALLKAQIGQHPRLQGGRAGFADHPAVLRAVLMASAKQFGQQPYMGAGVPDYDWADRIFCCPQPDAWQDAERWISEPTPAANRWGWAVVGGELGRIVLPKIAKGNLTVAACWLFPANEAFDGNEMLPHLLLTAHATKGDVTVVSTDSGQPGYVVFRADVSGRAVRIEWDWGAGQPLESPPPMLAIAWRIEPELLADLNGDGKVDGADLGYLQNNFGKDDPLADINGDGKVDGADLGFLLSAWSKD